MWIPTYLRPHCVCRVLSVLRFPKGLYHFLGFCWHRCFLSVGSFIIGWYQAYYEGDFTMEFVLIIFHVVIMDWTMDLLMKSSTDLWTIVLKFSIRDIYLPALLCIFFFQSIRSMRCYKNISNLQKSANWGHNLQGKQDCFLYNQISFWSQSIYGFLTVRTNIGPSFFYSPLLTSFGKNFEIIFLF